MPTQGEARSRQTAYLATEHWWRSRVEALAAKWHAEAERCAALGDVAMVVTASVSKIRAAELDALIAERNPR